MRSKYLILALLLTMLAILSACEAQQPLKPTPTPDSHATEQILTMALGEKLFNGTCIVCHGPNAEGITGLGPNLVSNSFVRNTSDAGLLAFIKSGRPANDPGNATGIPMPARGGNQDLTDEQLAEIVSYLRSLDKLAFGGG